MNENRNDNRAGSIKRVTELVSFDLGQNLTVKLARMGDGHWHVQFDDQWTDVNASSIVAPDTIQEFIAWLQDQVGE